MTTKSSRRSWLDNQRLLPLLSLAILPLWGLCLLFTYFVPPQSALAMLVFFLLFGAALFSTLTPSIYLLTRQLVGQRLYQASVRHALRQAGLIDAWAIFNLLLRLLSSWNIFTAIVSFGIIVVLELLALGRK